MWLSESFTFIETTSFSYETKSDIDLIDRLLLCFFSFANFLLEIMIAHEFWFIMPEIKDHKRVSIIDIIVQILRKRFKAQY